METVATFAQRMKEAMGDDSYADAAQKLGVAKSTIASYVTGTRNPKRAFIKMVADVYNVSPVWLMGADVPRQGRVEEKSAQEQEMANLLEEMRTRDDCRMLFSLARDATPDDVRLAATVLEKLRNKEGGK